MQQAEAVLQSDKSTIVNLHHAATALVLLEQKIANSGKIVQLAQAQCKTDDSIVALGHALHLAALLGDSGEYNAYFPQAINELYLILL